VDPAFAIERYLEAAAAEGVRIVRVLETHTHADHLSGHGRFALEHGLPVSIHPRALPEYPFDPLEDGQVLRVGAVEIRVVHTPGHRPEHCAFVVDGGLVLTGDSLFVAGAARPDLALDARASAADLFHSLQRLAELPDAVVVYPGHVAGSLCGAHMSDEHSSSIGREKQTNLALRADELEFVEESASLSTPRPPTTERLVTLNRGPWVAKRPPLAEIAELANPDDGGDALVIDARPIDVFAAGHLPGAISVALDGGSFATRAAFVLDPAEPFAIYAASKADAEEAYRLVTAVGLHEAAGWLRGRRGDGGEETTATVSVPEFDRLLESGDLHVLDVREAEEREEHPLPAASVALPIRLLRVAPPGELDRARPVHTICASGARATLAASLLARWGYDARPAVGGGVQDLAGRVGVAEPSPGKT
jgi:hydroxyacylglutathione hydrolase